MSVVEYQRGDYVISTDKSKLDPGSIHRGLWDFAGKGHIWWYSNQANRR